MYAKGEVQELVWDDEILDKRWRKHRVEAWEVEEVVFDDEEAGFRWERSRRHGWRLLVRERTSGGHRLLVILQPVDRKGGVRRCASA